MNGNSAWLDQADVPLLLCYCELRRTPVHQASIHLLGSFMFWYLLHLSWDTDVLCMGEGESWGEFFAAEIIFLWSFSSSKFVFQTLSFSFQGYSDLFPSQSFFFSTHITSVHPSPLSRWVQSRTILSTHKIKYVCLYLPFGISAVLHSRRVTYGKHGLPHNTVLSRADFFCVVHNSGQLDTERGITCDQTQSQGHERISLLLLLFSLFSPVSIHLTSPLTFLLFNPPCAMSCDLQIDPSY